MNVGCVVGSPARILITAFIVDSPRSQMNTARTLLENGGLALLVRRPFPSCLSMPSGEGLRAEYDYPQLKDIPVVTSQ